MEIKKLSVLDRNLTWWIFIAMLIGIALGWVLPESNAKEPQSALNIPLAVGLIIMMFPPLAKVKFENLPKVLKHGKVIWTSLLLNWIIGPILMFVLAKLFLSDKPELMSGVIIIGLARCIAMVLVWNDLADGDREMATALVALNSIFQVLTFSTYTYVFLNFIPQHLGQSVEAFSISSVEVAKIVLLYLGVPFVIGFLIRRYFINRNGESWYEKNIIPKISPLTLVALLLTIIYMFSLKARQISTLPIDVLRVAVPLVIYFAIMFVMSFWLSKKFGANYNQCAAVSFTATGNNFELAIAVAIGVFGINSQQAFAGVIGPLIEVPALILLVQLSKKWEQQF